MVEDGGPDFNPSGRAVAWTIPLWSLSQRQPFHGFGPILAFRGGRGRPSIASWSSGLASLACVRLLRPAARIAVMSRVSCAFTLVAAQGGINAALGNHRKAVTTMWSGMPSTLSGRPPPTRCRGANDGPRPQAIYELENGAAPSRTPEGRRSTQVWRRGFPPSLFRGRP